MSAIGFRVYRDSSIARTYPLAGGWVLDPATTEELEGTAPRSFDFKEDTVDIQTVDGQKLTCAYEIEDAEDGFVGPLTIHDYLGSDLTFDWSKQPSVVLKLSGDEARGRRYLFAG